MFTVKVVLILEYKMSTSITSWKNVLELARRFYDKNLPLYYSISHLKIIRNAIGYVMGVRSYNLVETTVPLLEPIISHNNTVFISRPLVAHYINQPIYTPVTQVNFLSNVNLLDELSVPIVQNEDLNVLSSEYSNTYIKQFSREEGARFHQLLRAIILVVHWNQHRERNISFTTHEDFSDLEMTNTKDQENEIIHSD
ncbi:GbNV_gp60-like [Fopius arisanus]|nr:GbNV_gp60-like [Fopius arisanus]